VICIYIQCINWIAVPAPVARLRASLKASSGLSPASSRSQADGLLVLEEGLEAGGLHEQFAALVGAYGSARPVRGDLLLPLWSLPVGRLW